MNGEKPKRGIVFFVLAGLVVVVGGGFFVYLLFAGISGITKSVIRVDAPGVQELSLEQAGTYTIFLESTGVEKGTVVDPIKQAHGLNVRVETESGESIPVGPSGMSQTYNYGSRRGVSIMEFKVTTPGQYRFITSFNNDRQRGPVVLTVSHGFVGRLFKVILTSIAVVMGSLLAAAVFIVLGILDLRAKRKSTAPGTPPPIG